MRHQLSSGLTAVGGLLTLVAGLALIDVRVRQELSDLVNRRRPPGELASIGASFRHLAYVGIEAVHEQTIEHAPQVIFSLAAIVLVMFLLRTRI